MRFVLERLSEPAIEPITLAELKLHLRTNVVSTTEDGMLNDLIASARQWVEGHTGRILVDQSWRLTLLGRSGVFSGGDVVGGFRGPGPVNPGYICGDWVWGRQGEIPLRKSPVLALSSFVSVGADGVETTIAASMYELREPHGKWPRLVALSGATWSTWLTGDMRATFRAGYADRTGSPTDGADVIPARFKTAIKLVAESFYDRGPDATKLVDAAKLVLFDDCCEFSMA